MAEGHQPAAPVRVGHVEHVHAPARQLGHITLGTGAQPPQPGRLDQAGPRIQGGPGLVIAPWQGGSGEVVRATNIPPIESDLPDELQTRSGLQ